MTRAPIFAVLLVLAGLPVRAATDDPAAAEAPAPKVTVAPVTRGEIEDRVAVPGSLIAQNEVQVYPQVAGYEITALFADVGDRVEAGARLATLDDATLKALTEQAEAEFQRAGAAVDQAQSQIASAEAAQQQAVLALARARKLQTTGNAAQATLEQAVATEASAKAQAAAARDGLRVAAAGRAQAQAALDIARLNLSRTEIVSPVAGVVSARNAAIGALSGNAAQPLFAIIADNVIELEGDAIETDLPRLSVGQEAVVQVAGVGEIGGHVRLVPPSVDPATRLGKLRITLNPDARLRTGIFASGWVIVERRDGLTVPASALLADATGFRVQVVKDGVVETREVVPGLLWQGRREIVKGLAEGETVMVRAGAFFRSGDRVSVAQDAPVAAAPASLAPAQSGGDDTAQGRSTADDTAEGAARPPAAGGTAP